MTSQYKTKKTKDSLGRTELERLMAETEHIRGKVDQISNRLYDHYALLREIWQSVNRETGANDYDFP